jgi:hypothetical protein
MPRRPLHPPRIASCVALRFEVFDDDHGIVAEAVDPALSADRWSDQPFMREANDAVVVGSVRAEYSREGPCKINVVDASVAPYARRCGVATKLYELVANRACGHGLRLCSDYRRTPESEAFWQKQAAKGRAICRGWQKRGRERWYCTEYQLKSCPVRSLAG